MAHHIQHTDSFIVPVLRHTRIIPVGRRARRAGCGVFGATLLTLLGGVACGSAEREGGPGVGLSSQAVTQASSPSASATPDVVLSPAPAAAAAAPQAQALSAEESSARAEIALENVEQHSDAWQREYRHNELAALRVALQTKRELLQQAEAVRPTQATAERDLLDQKTARLQANITAVEQRVQALEAQPN